MREKDQSRRSSSRQNFKRCSVKKVFLEISQNSQEKSWGEISVLMNLKKETLTQVFSL